MTDIPKQAEPHNASAPGVETRLARLREANEHLVLSTLGAEDRQASAEAAAQQQTQFLSMLAHELRNPLQPIVHANALLGHIADGNHEQVRLQSIITRQINHMTRMIDDLLDASRISNGKIALEKNTLLLSEVISMALETTQPQVEPRRQRIAVVQPAQEVPLHADRIRLAQVFSNLLNNASKFSPEGGVIELNARIIDQFIEITVRDHGMGIPPGLLPHVFDLFTQGQQSLDRGHGGLGIGLALVRTLVELHGGSVHADSCGDGLGATFVVRLPLPDANYAPAPAPPLAPVETRPLRILVVEDNVDANDSLCMLLELGGHTVLQTYEGNAALQTALTAELDLLICDIGLPGIDGFTVVAKLKAALGPRAPLCVAISGYNQPQDRDRAAASGFDIYLVKPVDFDSLQNIMDKHVQ